MRRPVSSIASTVFLWIAAVAFFTFSLDSSLTIYIAFLAAAAGAALPAT